MKAPSIIRLVIICTLLPLVFTKCCCKKECGNGRLLINEDIHIAYSGFTDLGKDSVYSGLIDLGKDSVFLKEYDLSSRQLVKTTLLTGLYLDLGQQYVALNDSFYLNQRFFILTRPGETDTINNINYQIGRYEYCSNCLGQHDYAPNVINFTYGYKGVKHSYSDTIYISR